MEVQLKARSRNFTEFEKHFLFELVTHEYLHIIENKKTDGVNCAKKQAAWKEIVEKFNSQAQTGPRNAKQLHSLYDILKRNARTNLHSDKKNLYKTGGGTFTPKSTTLDEKIIAVLTPQFEPLPNQFDSSCDYYANSNNAEFNHPVLIEEIESPPEASSSQVVCSVETPVREKPKSTDFNKKSKRKSVEIIAKRICTRKNLKDKIDEEVHEAKLNILKIEQKIKEKEMEAIEKKIQHEQQMFEIEFKIKNKELLLKEMQLKNIV